MKINNFRGDLTDNSAKKEALVVYYSSRHVTTSVAGFLAEISLRSHRNCLFLVSKNIFVGSKYPKENQLILEKTSLVWPHPSAPCPGGLISNPMLRFAQDGVEILFKSRIYHVSWYLLIAGNHVFTRPHRARTVSKGESAMCPSLTTSSIGMGSWSIMGGLNIRAYSV